MDDYIAKPVKPGQLIDIVEKWGGSSEKTESDDSVDIASQDKDIFDKNGLFERAMGDKELAQELIDLFFDHVPGKIDDLEKALEHKNNDSIKQLAHNLKGSAGNIGAIKLQETALKLENAGKANNINEAILLVSEIKHRFEAFKQHIVAINL